VLVALFFLAEEEFGELIIQFLGVGQHDLGQWCGEHLGNHRIGVTHFGSSKSGQRLVMIARAPKVIIQPSIGARMVRWGRPRRNGRVRARCAVRGRAWRDAAR